MQNQRREAIKEMAVAGMALALMRPKFDLNEPLPEVRGARGVVATDAAPHPQMNLGATNPAGAGTSLPGLRLPI